MFHVEHSLKLKIFKHFPKKFYLRLICTLLFCVPMRNGNKFPRANLIVFYTGESAAVYPKRFNFLSFHIIYNIYTFEINIHQIPAHG